MQKNIRKIIMVSLVMLLICMLAVMVSCKPKENRVIAIEFVSNASLKNIYNIDEVFDFSDIKIRATYKNGDKKDVVVTPGMLTSFDTSKTGENLHGVITYEGAKLDFVYNVNYEVDIKTSFRLAYRNINIEENTVTFDLVSVGTDEKEGIYALYAGFQTTGEAQIESFTLAQESSANFTLTKGTQVSGKIPFIILAKDGNTPFKKEQLVLKIKAKVKPNVYSKISLVDFKVSDGKEDMDIPIITTEFYKK